MTNDSVFPDLAIVIVNLNLKVDTQECIQSLLQAGASLEQIIVVDNHSTDGSVEYLKKDFGDKLHIIEQDRNRGYPYGLNRGVERLLNNDVHWSLLLNNDIIVAEDFLRQLGRAKDKYPSFSIFSPLMFYYDNPKRVWFLIGREIPGTLLSYSPWRNKIADDQLPELIPGEFVVNCAILVKNDVFKKIGLFDETSIIYGDDVEFSWRAHRAGFKSAGFTPAKMWHKVSSTMKRQRPKTRYLSIRNQIRFYRQYANILQKILLIFFTLIRCAGMIFIDILRGHFDLLKPTLSGWRDGWWAAIARDIE